MVSGLLIYPPLIRYVMITFVVLLLLRFALGEYICDEHIFI